MVCSGVSVRPSSALMSCVTTSPARAGLLASTIRSRCFASIHTFIVERLVKAIGKSSRVACSFSSFTCFLPGLRPLACSTCCASSSVRRLTTADGSALRSTISIISHCPPTASISGACSLPRGDTQPSDCGWVAPHSAKRAPESPSSICASVACHSGPTRYTVRFLNKRSLLFQVNMKRPADLAAGRGRRDCPRPGNRADVLE